MLRKYQPAWIYPLILKLKKLKYLSHHPRSPKLEFRIPISPNEKYMRMLHYFMESLQEFGGDIGQSAHCVVSVSPETDQFDLYESYPWTKNHSIEFQWVDKEEFLQHSYFATGYHRLMIKSKADIVILADADILIANDFDSAIIRSYREQRLLGFIAHISPFQPTQDNTDISSEWYWGKIFNDAKLPKPTFEFEHTGWGLMSKQPTHRYCPAYFNFGFIISPRSAIELMARTYKDEISVIDRVVDTWFKSQIANTLSFTRHNIPVGTLPLNYNFPLHVDDQEIRRLNPDPEGKDSAEDIAVFHYLGNGEINKDHFATEESLNEILQKEGMSEAGKMFQKKLRMTHKRIKQKDMQ